MDTTIARKSKKNKYLAIGLPIFLILIFIVYSSVTKKRSFNVNKNEITIKTVENGYFEDFVILQAKVEPINSMLINIIEGGAVQEIYVGNGDMITKGQPLVRLYNPNTELSYMQQETAFIEQINNLNKAKLDLRNQELLLAKDLALIEHDFLDAKQLYESNKNLYALEILSRNEWDKTQENYRYQQERMNIIKESTTREKLANQIQIEQINKSVAIMEKSLGVLRVNKKNFLIVAPLSGRLSSFEPILGKTYAQGVSIGTIDVMSGYKLIADVDEYYLDRISTGLKGSIDFENKTVGIQISKIIPEIKNGRFQAEMNFISDKTLDLKQGISFGVRINLSEKTKSTVLSRGSFNEDTGGDWIFVVNGNKAERRQIKLGRENPLYYEVLEGLKAGEKVVTSSYKDYKDIEVLQIL